MELNSYWSWFECICRLFLTTRNPNPELTPDISSVVNEVNFTTTRAGLTGQVGHIGIILKSLRKSFPIECVYQSSEYWHEILSYVNNIRDHGDTILNRSYSYVFLFRKIYWYRLVFDLIRAPVIRMKPETLRHQPSSKF